MSAAFQLPPELEQLIQDGHWPTKRHHIQMQNCDPLVPAELVRRVFPNESLFCFCLPPFKFLADLPAEENWRAHIARPDQLDHSKALVIADFELGSDSAVVLDYDANPAQPPVKWLRYDGSRHTYWDTACETFAALAEKLQLDSLSFGESAAEEE